MVLFHRYILTLGQHGGAVVSTVAWAGTLCVEPARSPHVWFLSGWYSGFLPQSKDTQKVRLIGFSKLSVGANVSVNVVVIYICQPCDELATYPGCTPPSATVSWGRLQPRCDPEKNK